MSDYFDRLIERAIAPEPLIRPRLPSPFESVPAGSAEETVERAASPLPHRDAESAEPAIPPDRIRTSVLHPREADSDFREAPPPRVAGERPAATASGEVEATSPQPSLRSEARPLESSVEADSAARPINEPGPPRNPPPAVAVPKATGVSPVAGPTRREPAMPVSPQRAPSMPGESAREEHVVRVVTPAQIREARTARPVESRNGIQIAPLFSPRASSHGDMSQAPVTTPAPIEIRIGRVEIRAVAPAATPARKTAPPHPRLTLEHYLKQANGGSR